MKKFSFYGIIISLFVGIFLCQALAKDSENLPPHSDYVNDFAGIIDSQEQQSINSLIKELNSKTTSQVAVVTVQTTNPESIEQYVVKLFAGWGIGQKGKDNGVL